MSDRPATTDQTTQVYGAEQPWDEAGCSRSCRTAHTRRWGSCAYAEEPTPTLSRFEVGPAEDGCWYRFELSPDVTHDPMCPCTKPHGQDGGQAEGGL